VPEGFEVTGHTKSTLVLRGTPTKVGTITFTVYAVHGRASNGCSTMPDPHAFSLEILDEPEPGLMDAGIADASPD
jgi:hypothetical protein